MDIIDFLWAIGGWFLIIPDMIMAAICTFKNPSKSNAFYLFIGLIFLLLVVLVNSSESDPSIPSTKTQIFVPAPSSTTTVTTLRPKRSGVNSWRRSSFTQRQYEAGDHEVPSGPNPISN